MCQTLDTSYLLTTTKKVDIFLAHSREENPEAQAKESVNVPLVRTSGERVHSNVCLILQLEFFRSTERPHRLDRKWLQQKKAGWKT